MIESKPRTKPIVELTYRQVGDVLLPNIEIEPWSQPERPLTKYGLMHKTYLEENKSLMYATMSAMGKLLPHCLEVQDRAEARVDELMAAILEKNPPPNRNEDPFGWVAHMNAVKAQAEEIMYPEIIYIPAPSVDK